MSGDLAMFTPVAGDAVEGTIARDLARKAAIIAPVVIAIGFAVKGGGGALGATIALGVVAINFVLAAALMTWGAKVSAGALMGASLGGFIVRLAVITIAAIGIRAVNAIHFPTFLIVLVVAHLGLLAWELRSVSLTLAYPGLKPKKERVIAALFPNGINELFDWRAIFGEGSIWAFNKTAALALFSTAICLFVFVIGGRKRALVPTGLQNVAEAGYEFVEKQIAEPVIGGHHGEGKKWAPYLGVLFFFILFMNIWSTVPPIQFPATSRIAIPIILSLSVWVAFIFAGFKAQGPLYPIKTCAPSGVPKALLPLVFIIEFFSKFLVRPLSLSVRLFANMLAGHVLISVFAIMTNELVVKHPSGVYQIPIGILPFVMLVFMTIFELLVAFLQAYIFITLAAVYIGDSISTDH